MKRSRPDPVSRDQLLLSLEDLVGQPNRGIAGTRGVAVPPPRRSAQLQGQDVDLAVIPLAPPLPPMPSAPTPHALPPASATGSHHPSSVPPPLPPAPAPEPVQSVAETAGTTAPDVTDVSVCAPRSLVITSAQQAQQTQPPHPEQPQHPQRTQEIVYRRNDRARRYILRVDRRGVVSVTIPRRGSLEAAQKFVATRAAWIQRQQVRRASLRRDEDKRKSASVVLLRGVETAWTLEPTARGSLVVLIPVMSAADVDDVAELPTPPRREAVEVRRRGARTSITTSTAATASTSDSTPTRAVLLAALRGLAEAELPVRTEALAKQHGVRIARVTVRAQRSRWGSCSADGAISLNWRLIHAPPHVRDYLIIHELMHRRQMNHSARYWREVAAVCPDYAAAEKWLDTHSYLLDDTE